MGTPGTSRKVIVEPTAEGATRAAAELFKTILCDTTARGGRCCVALAGGTTPHAMYQQLARTGVAETVLWPETEVFFGDERDVPHDHVESNYGMAQRTLLDDLPIPPGRIHPMRADADDLRAAAAEYEQTIRRRVPAGDDGVPRFDLILLGMGGDGHTASIFPCTPEAMEESERLVLAHFVPVLGRSRMTFTFPLINAARNAMLLVTGEDKAEAVQRLLGDDEDAKSDLPAARVRLADGVLFVVLDTSAARLTNV